MAALTLAGSPWTRRLTPATHFRGLVGKDEKAGRFQGATQELKAGAGWEAGPIRGGHP
jgi:hypothetical protein